MAYFSVIVPVFNCEKYLAECIESVITQSFTDWELLLIDDGSTDASGEICDRYSKTDNRITVVHKENGGEFSARKVGVDISSGDYITGLDSDDYYEKNHLKDIYETLQKHNVDCISFPVRYFGARDGITDVIAPNGKVLDRDEYMLLCIRNTDFSFCDKAVRAQCYKNTDYSDVPPVRFSEDMLMVVPALCRINSGMGMKIGSYRYRIHDESSNSKICFKHIEFNDQAACYNIKKIKEAGIYTSDIERAYTIFLLHSMNVRVWALFVSGLWEKEMSDKLIGLTPFVREVPRDVIKDFDIKERTRINLILERRFGILGLLAYFYRLLGKRVEL